MMRMSDLLSLGRMARRLGVTQQWLREQADAGKVPCLRAGKRYLFSVAAVQEALAVQAARTRRKGADDE
jgi:excisionase family DNA binding protein